MMKATTKNDDNKPFDVHSLPRTHYTGSDSNVQELLHFKLSDGSALGKHNTAQHKAQLHSMHPHWERKRMQRLFID